MVLKTNPIFLLALILGNLFISGCDKIQVFIEANNYGHDLADSTQQDTTETDVTATRHPDGRQAELLSAFFGLDDGLPRIANKGICEGASGKDGMPVVFSHEIDLSSMQAGDFRVVSASGAIGRITCVTLAPADDVGESRTVLVVGQYGSIDDQPVSVEIIGNLLSKDGQVNFRGARSSVIALEEGPTITWAEIVPEEQWELGKSATLLPFGGGSGCPLGTRQVVRVTWAGGVTKPGGHEIDDKERTAYRVTMSVDGASEIELVPFAIGDLGDGDNNHELCLDRDGMPLNVEFPAGLVTDPREDLNPPTRAEVTVG
jgi:hypothetical protein